MAGLLAAGLIQRARGLDRADPEGELAVNTDHPGYLTRRHGEFKIHVPFFLADVFPGRAVLDELLPLVLGVSVGAGGSLCVSGSTTFMGRLRMVGDIDICEYVFKAVGLPVAVMGHAHRADDAVLSLVAIDGQDFWHPWDGCEEGLIDFVRQGVPRGTSSRRLKLDFVGAIPSLGPLPATNVVLWLDPNDPETGNALRSFAHQEAVIDRGCGIARTLVSPARLGAYLLFLRNQATDLTHSSPVKALKRTLSMCSLFGLQWFCDDALELLDHHAVSVMSRAKRLDELVGLVSRSDPAERPQLEAMLNNERLDVDAEPIEESEVMIVAQAIQELIGSVFALIDGWTNAYEADNEPQ